MEKAYRSDVHIIYDIHGEQHIVPCKVSGVLGPNPPVGSLIIHIPKYLDRYDVDRIEYEKDRWITCKSLEETGSWIIHPDYQSAQSHLDSFTQDESGLV